MVDVVLLWWRDDDGDLVDALSTPLISLGDGGVVWLLTPKAGRPGTSSPATSATPRPRRACTRPAASAPPPTGRAPGW